MKLNTTTTIAALAIAASTFGCTNTMVARMNGLSGYEEHVNNGRIYVLSSPEAIKEFKDTGAISIAKTRIGAGPNRETVVLDSNKKDSSRDDALWIMFKRNHGM